MKSSVSVRSLGDLVGSARPAGCRRRSPGSSGGCCAGRHSRPGEGAQQVQRRRRLAVGLDQPLRVGLARFRRELHAVDDVAAIGRQGDAVWSRCPRSAAWRTGRPCGPPSPPACRRRRSAPPPSAGSRGRCRGCCRRWNSSKLSAQSPPCSRKALPSDDVGQGWLSGAAPRRQTPSGGKLRSVPVTESRAAASGYSGTWRMGMLRQLSGDHFFCIFMTLRSLAGPGSHTPPLLRFGQK